MAGSGWGWIIKGRVKMGGWRRVGGRMEESGGGV